MGTFETEGRSEGWLDGIGVLSGSRILKVENIEDEKQRSEI